MLEAFPNEDSIQARLNPHDNYDEKLLELEDQLKDRFWNIVNTLLTKRQKRVIMLLAEGKTQMEIAKILNVNQSSITKNLNGNSEYHNGIKTSYGGSKKKLRKLAEEDPEVIAILNQIREIKDNKW
jgi:DNA-binding CsgD family transcriptional regulator